MSRARSCSARKQSEQWSADDKLAVMIETEGLAEAELAAYCCEKGVFAEQIKVKILRPAAPVAHVVFDASYVRKTEQETSVLFELITHRYERYSMIITSNKALERAV